MRECAPPEDGGFSLGEAAPFFVAVEHPEGPRLWPEQYRNRTVEFAVLDEAPDYFKEPSPFAIPYRRVVLERVPVYAERCLLGWAFVQRGHDPVTVLRGAYGDEWIGFDRELAYEARVIEPRRHAHLLATLGIRP